MQFFVVLIGMVPLTIIAIKETGGIGPARAAAPPWA
jgi:hypothetical protein